MNEKIYRYVYREDIYIFSLKNGFISKRAEIVSVWEDFLNAYLAVCNKDPYDENTNPEGYINLGTAVNNMCWDIIEPRISSSEVWHCDLSLMQYREGYGIDSFREALATIMTKFVGTHTPVDPNNLFCTVGVTSSIDLLVHCIADPGDVILAPTPIYPRIYTDFKQRSEVDLWPIPVITAENSSDSQHLTMEKINNAYSSALEQKQKVRGIFLINPNNPLGDIYDPELLMEILLFCKKHKLHAIIDEVYALSVFPEYNTFHSVLKFEKLPDTNRTHVLYGLSKDFGFAGLRIGAIHTQNKLLQKCLTQLTFFQTIPFPVMGIITKFFEDLDWCQNYISINQQRLSEKYKYCVRRLKQMGVQPRDSVAGFFVWVNFQSVCGSNSFEEEKEFFEFLIKEAHLYIVPGKELLCSQPGWFRVTFSGNPDHVEEGLNRLEEAVKNYKSLKS